MTAKCECGCGEPAAPRGRFADSKHRLAHWQRTVLAPSLLPVVLDDMGDEAFRAAIRAACERRWGAGRFRVRYGGMTNG